MSSETPPQAEIGPTRRQGLSRAALIVALIVGLIAPLAVSSWYTFSLQRQALEKSFQFEIDQITETLANGMSDSVWNLIPESGRPLIDAAMRDPRILAVRVHSDAQGEFLSMGPIEERPQLLELTREIRHAGDRIGSLTVYFDASTAYGALAGQWRRIGVAAGAELIIILAMMALVGWLYVRHQRAEILQVSNRQLRREVEERRRTEAALRESEERFRGVIGNSPEAIFLTDLEGRFRLFNSRFSNWHGRQADEVCGKTSYDIFPKECADVFTALDRHVLDAGETEKIELEIPFVDGGLHTVIVAKFPVFGSDGAPIGVGTINTDVTEQRRTEEALKRSQRLEAIGQLTGGVAHDFNNLLAVILGNIELLEDQIGENQLLATIDRAANRGADLTQRLLAFARQQTLQPQAIDLNELLPDLVDLLQSTLGEQVGISIHLPRDLWPVTADPSQLENAVLNLSINARDAMPGGGTLEIRCENVEVQDDTGRVGDELPAGDYVQISVRDDGTGMPEHILEHAFEPFFTTKELAHGSGLGLSMVYGFAHQTGGTAAIDSVPGEGTEVRMLLPVADVSAELEEEMHDDDLKRGQDEGILVLEDDPDVREYTVTALKNLGYRVLEAADADAAMQMVDAEADTLDLLLCDVVLPGSVSGPEFAAKARDRHPDLKFVFMSGYTADL